MIPYVICTALSCFFIRVGTRESKRTKKINIRVILAIIIPSILAGARDISVGIDISVYGVPFLHMLYREVLIRIWQLRRRPTLAVTCIWPFNAHNGCFLGTILD